MSQSTNIETSWSRWHNRLHKNLKIKDDLLPYGSSLLLSISGGQDSMALLKLISDLQRLYNWRIHIWHGNHGWHKESETIAKELELWCIKKGFKFSCQNASKEEVKNENCAREWRYKCLTKTAENIESKCKHVLTGHTASDQTETLIFNLARGTYLNGLSSLRDQRKLQDDISLIRPLIIFSREETYQICKDLNLPLWIDPTNTNLNINRNKIREEIIPILEEIHPGSSRRIASLTDKLADIKDNQNALIDIILKEINGKEGLYRRKLANISRESRLIIIAQWLKKSGGPTITSSQLDQISNAIKAKMPPGERILSKGWLIKWDKKFIQLFNTFSN